MAKRKSVELGIDLQVQNIDSSIKELEKLENIEGDVGKAASKLKKEFIDQKNVLLAYGKNIPTSQLKNIIKTYIELSNSLGDLTKKFKISQTAINDQKSSIANTNKELDEYTNKLKAARENLKRLEEANLKKNIAASVLDKPEYASYKAKLDAKGAKGIGGTAKDPKQARWNYMTKDPEAAQIVAEVNKTSEEQQQSIKKAREEIEGYQSKIKTLNKDLNDLKATLKDLQDQFKLFQQISGSLDVASDNINENTTALEKVRDAAIKAGESQVTVKEDTDKTSTSFQKAARSVINYTVIYQGLKRILRESVRTIKEMDDAITGMTVVTNLSREQAWEQVEAFQAIAKATSSTMTEIAGLTTEYLKQGRAMKDAKILAEETAKSAKIAGISTADAVQYMTSAINGFNLAATDATRVSDVFANLAAASATDFEELAIAVSKVSAQANLAGMSLEYTTALLAKGIETTQEAPESIGTALKTIVARMRELSDYGSTLEDGGSVNKVERALAAAGIELRNVNGEFRNLEDIFSELGPKWDYLNSNQQQAIAQAVAGTRQQSRFVAIMQDWGRTQELIAEANSSQGAAAAQYYDYAKGIEAALTRMKTSWEGFVQSLADNKIIITAINAATKIIETISAIPDGLKVAIGLYVAIGGLNKLREEHEIKMQAYRQMAMSEEEKARVAQESQLKLKDEEIEKEEAEVELLKEKVKLIEKLQKAIHEEVNNNKTNLDIKTSEAINANKTSINTKNSEAEGIQKKQADSTKKALENTSNPYLTINGEETKEEREAYIQWRGEQLELADQLKTIKEEINVLETENQNLQQGNLTAIDAEKSSNQEVLEAQRILNENLTKEQNTLEQTKSLNDQIAEKEQKLAEAKQYQMSASEIQLKNENDQEIQRLKLVNQKIKAEEELLKLKIAQAKAEGKDTSEQEKALSKLHATRTRNIKSIAKLEDKNKKLQEGSYNIYAKMANLIGNKLGINLKGTVESVKTIASFGKQILVDLGKLVLGAIARKKSEEDITKENNKQLANQAGNVAANTINAAITQKTLNDEKKKTKEDMAQAGAAGTELVANAANATVLKGQVKAEQDKGKEQKKNLLTKLKEAIATIGGTAGEPLGAGLPFAIAGLAVLATVGLATAGILSGVSANKNRESNIAEKQNQNYEMKKSNATYQKSLDEYRELQNKKVLNEEDQKRMEELEAQMQEMDESFANLKGKALTNAVSAKITAQKALINSNINSNYQEALDLKDINGSTVARQAIADKIIQSQEKLIDSNSQLINASEEQVAAIKNNASDMATKLADEMDWNKFGTTNKIDTTTKTLASTAAWIANPLLGVITSNIIKSTNKQAEREAALLEQSVNIFEEASTKMAINMEMAADDIRSQVEAYESSYAELESALNKNTTSNNTNSKKLEEFKNQALDIAKSQYGAVAYISELNQQYNGELLNKIEDIQAKTDGRISTDKILNMFSTFLEKGFGNNEKVGKAIEAENTILGKANLDGDWKGKVDIDLETARKALNLDANASINEIKNEMAKYIKTDSEGKFIQEDGVYKFKGKGNGFTGNDKQMTEIYKKLVSISDDLGDYADLSKSSLESIGLWNNSMADSVNRFYDIINNISNNILDQSKLLSDDLTQQDKEVGSVGYQLTESAYDIINQLEQQKNIQIQQKKEQLATLEEGSKQYKSITDEIKNLETEYKKASSSILQSVNEAVGYLSDSDWVNRAETLTSMRDTVQGYRDKLISGEKLTAEEVNNLWDNYLPALQKLDPTLTVNKFKKLFDEGGAAALKLLTDYLDNFKQTNNLVALDSIGVDRANAEENFKKLVEKGVDLGELTNYVKNTGDGELDLDKFDNIPWEELKKTYKDNNEILELINKGQEEYTKYYKASSLKEASDAELERQARLTEEEIKVANLKAKIDQISNDNSAHRLESIKAELEYTKLLSEELKKQLNDKKDIIKADLEKAGVDFAKAFEIKDGTVKINEEYYKTLDDDEQEAVTRHYNTLTEVVANEYETSKKIKDLYEEQLEETIDLQNTFIDAYKDKLEEEKDLVQESLDKRKDLYQEYFDWLNNQKEDETENDIATLQQRIANLSSATDAASLQALKKAQEELDNLQKESIQSKQEQLQQQILANLDKQSEQVDEYYNQQLEYDKQIIDLLSRMDQNSLIGMLKTADDYDNKTVEEQAQLDQKYAKLLSGWFNMGSAAVPGYSSGGIVDYTGLAMVHGSTTQPEAFLNAEQTALFSKLSELLVSQSGGLLINKLNGIEPNTVNNNITIENFDININADMREDQDLYNTGNSIADIFLERIQASGIPVNIKR